MITTKPIYAGDTPLFNSIICVQTAPMQLTVRAGSFRSTGEAAILDTRHPLPPSVFFNLPDGGILPVTVPPLADALTDGRAEMLADQVRVRLWRPDQLGLLPGKSQTYTLPGDVTFTLTAAVGLTKYYKAELGLQTGIVTVLMRSRLDGDYPSAPATWQKVHDLMYEFAVPLGTADLTPLTIFVLEVRPGFPG